MEELPWQASSKAGLAAAMRAGRLSHALLLSAYPGWGATELGMWLALEVLQHRRKVDDIRQLAHPDFRWIAPQRGRIPVDEIRRLSEFTQGAAQIAPAKAAVLEDADRMNVNAANALLKTLEEPPGDTHLILTSQRLGALPPTIRSRCQTVAIARDPKVARIWLTGAKARALLSDYDGAPLLAAAGAAAGERPMADLLTELAQANRQRTAQLLEELLALDPSRLAARWLRCLLVAMTPGGAAGEGASATDVAQSPALAAAQFPLLPADRRTFAFVDELMWFHLRVSLSGSVNLRLDLERLCHLWRSPAPRP